MLLYIFVGPVMHFFMILWWIQSSKEQHLFETKSFVTLCYVNVFTVTFDQLNVSLLNKKYFLSTKQTNKTLNDPQLLNGVNISWSNVAASWKK